MNEAISTLWCNYDYKATRRWSPLLLPPRENEQKSVSSTSSRRWRGLVVIILNLMSGIGRAQAVSDLVHVSSQGQFGDTQPNGDLVIHLMSEFGDASVLCPSEPSTQCVCVCVCVMNFVFCVDLCKASDWRNTDSNNHQICRKPIITKSVGNPYKLTSNR